MSLSGSPPILGAMRRAIPFFSAVAAGRLEASFGALTSGRIRDREEGQSRHVDRTGPDSSHEPARLRPPDFAQNFSGTGAIPPLIPSSFLIDSMAGDGSRRCVVNADIVEKRGLLPWRSGVPMFCTAMTPNAIQGCAPRCRYEALFDAVFVRSEHGFLERDFVERQRIGPSRIGLLGEGRAGICPAVLGGEAQPDAAGRVQTLGRQGSHPAVSGPGTGHVFRAGKGRSSG